MGKKILTMCRYCESETFQYPLFIKRAKVREEGGEEVISYIVLECGGCNMISFLARSKDPFPIPGEQPYIDRNFYYDMEEDDDDFNILREKDYDKLPAKIQGLYDEVIVSFEEELQVMAGTGLRSLVEAICNHQQIKGGNLQEKIASLYKNGLISAAELLILDKLRLIGNQSIHRGKTFSLNKLSYALDIINHVLISIYVLPKINKHLKII
jgi:hypothetical protein